MLAFTKSKTLCANFFGGVWAGKESVLRLRRGLQSRSDLPCVRRDWPALLSCIGRLVAVEQKAVSTRDRCLPLSGDGERLKASGETCR
jgi:hypothetical protein